MRKMCTLITSKGTDIDENIANQNHATRTRTPKPGYLNLSIGSNQSALFGNCGLVCKRPGSNFTNRLKFLFKRPGSNFS